MLLYFIGCYFNLKYLFFNPFLLTFKNLFEQNSIQMRKHSTRSSWECSTDKSTRARDRLWLKRCWRRARKWLDWPWWLDSDLESEKRLPLNPFGRDHSESSSLPRCLRDHISQLKRASRVSGLHVHWVERAFLFVRTCLKGPEASLHSVLTVHLHLSNKDPQSFVCRSESSQDGNV